MTLYSARRYRRPKVLAFLFLSALTTTGGTLRVTLITDIPPPTATGERQP